MGKPDRAGSQKVNPIEDLGGGVYDPEVANTNEKRRRGKGKVYLAKKIKMDADGEKRGRQVKRAWVNRNHRTERREKDKAPKFSQSPQKQETHESVGSGGT